MSAEFSAVNCLMLTPVEGLPANLKMGSWIVGRSAVSCSSEENQGAEADLSSLILLELLPSHWQTLMLLSSVLCLCYLALITVGRPFLQGWRHFSPFHFLQVVIGLGGAVPQPADSHHRGCNIESRHKKPSCTDLRSQIHFVLSSLTVVWPEKVSVGRFLFILISITFLN